MDLGLTGKAVLVTGASSGIGRATALMFADEKAHIAVGYHTDRQAAEETAAQAEKRGAHAICWQLDLGQPDSLEAAVAHARRELGPISVLVNNAVRWPGWPDPGELFETAPPERFTLVGGCQSHRPLPARPRRGGRFPTRCSSTTSPRTCSRPSTTQRTACRSSRSW